MDVALSSNPLSQVVLQVRVPSGRALHRPHGLRSHEGAAQVGVDDHPGRVDDAAQVRPLRLGQDSKAHLPDVLRGDVLLPSREHPAPDGRQLAVDGLLHRFPAHPLHPGPRPVLRQQDVHARDRPKFPLDVLNRHLCPHS